jgi:transcriptional regulator with XRE-family HTH domain
MRDRRGWTRTELARRAGLGRMVVSRIERGATNLDLDVLQRVGIALARPVIVTFGRDPGEAPADAGHLAIQELVLRLGRAVGYDGSFELPTRSTEPWRSVDVGLAAPARHRLLLVECWNTIGDVGAAARSSERKRADLDALVAGRWGAEVRVGVLWVVRATARNRTLVQRYPEVFAARFPGASRAWVDALASGSPPPIDPGLVWCDVGATRIFEWRRR